MAVIDTANHLYITCRFKGVDTITWKGETWQYGVRVRVGSNQVGLTDGVVDLPVFSTQDAAVQRNTADWSVDQGWSGVTVGSNAVTDGDTDALVDAIASPFLDSKSSLSVAFELDVVKVYAVHEAPDGRWLSGVPNAYYPIAKQAGSVNTSLPPDNALVVSFYTATRGVKGRGRVYMGSLPQSALDQYGRFGSQIQDKLGQGFADAFEDVRNIGGTLNMKYSPIVWHRPGDKLGLEDGTRASVISRVEVNDIVDTQRRRDKQADVNWRSFPVL